MPIMQANDFLKVEIPDFLKMESLSACSTPGHSPSPAPSSMGFGAPLIRRPSRKSTLTQQQKNQKRQRATQDQLNTLEFEFTRNPTPAAVVRERIASEINMTERSVQIWFQNRRAKIKNIAKKHIETGDDYEAMPDSMRGYLAMQAMETGKPFMNDDFFGTSAGAYGNGILFNADPTSSKVMIYHLASRSLSIGAWKRIGQTQLDLVVFYSPSKAMLTYYIQADGSGFRIEYPFSSVDSITLDNGDGPDATKTGGLIIKLNRPPIFTMDQGSGGWFQCRDFTEDQQASKVLTHYLGGHPKVLSGQLAKLASLETFQNRHDPMGFAAGMPGPEIISPPIHRPSSQPNHFVHPHRQQSAFATDGNFSMGPPPPRGHKRQRSRSVPVAVDFSQLRQPITPLPLVMHQHQHFHNHFSNNRNTPLYAPVPQHTQQRLQHASPAIRVDGGCAYIDMPPALSTSGTSPTSDFDLNSANSSDPCYLQTPFSHTSFNMHSIPESAATIETPMSAQSQHNGMQNTPDHFVHLQTPCPAPLQRSHSTSAIPQLANDPFSSMIMKNELGSTQGMVNGSTNDLFDPIDSDSLLLQDDFAYDSFLSDPTADPFFDYSALNGDMFDLLQMPMNAQSFNTTTTMNTTSTEIQSVQGKRHCAKQSLSLPLRLNMIEQGNANMGGYLKVHQQPQQMPKGMITPMGEEFSFLAVSDDEVKEEDEFLFTQ